MFAQFSPFRLRPAREDSAARRVVAPETASTAGASAERLPLEEVRVSMARVVFAWAFGAAFFNLSAGAVFTSFARRIGADERDMGLLFAALPLMSFLQVLSAWTVEKTGRRKRQMMIAGLIGRSLWIVMPLLPFFVQWFPGHITNRQILPMAIICVLIASACQAFTGPAFFAWMADLVPSRVRPVFFAQRMQVGTTVAMFTALLSGVIADKFPSLEVYSVLLALAGLCGLMDIALFFGVKEPPATAMPKTGEGKLPPPWTLLHNAWREPEVRRFLAFVALLTAGYGLTGAFGWLFALEYLGLSKTSTGLILNIMPLLGIALTSRFWGEMIQRYGNRPVIQLCSLGLAVTPLGFLSARSDAWLGLAVAAFLSGIAVAGIELTNFNQITGLAPHVPRATMTAVFSIVAGTSMAAASLLGGQLAHALKWINEMDFELFGLPMVNYHILFGIGLLLRLVNATFVVPRLCEPTATATLEAVKEVVPEIIESFAERLSRPVHIRHQEN